MKLAMECNDRKVLNTIHPLTLGRAAWLFEMQSLQRQKGYISKAPRLGRRLGRALLAAVGRRRAVAAKLVAHADDEHLARAQDGRGERGRVDRVGEGLRLEAEPVVLLVPALVLVGLVICGWTEL